MATLAFFERLFGELIEGASVGLWCKGEPARFSSDLAEVADEAGSMGYEDDVWFSAAPQFKDRARAKGGRWNKASAAGLVAVWADIDVETGSKGQTDRHPATIEMALAFLDTLPIRPSMVVETGGGVHAWWVLDEPWWFGADGKDVESDRGEAAAVLAGFERFVRGQMAAHGWELDSTAELARMMRIPGTVNAKYDPPRPVRLLEWEGAPVALSDVREWADVSEDSMWGPEARGVALDGEERSGVLHSPAAGVARPRGPVSIETGALTSYGEPARESVGPEGFYVTASGTPFVPMAGVVVDARRPAPAKLKIVLEQDAAVAALWDRRKKMPNDSSPSAFVLALANHLVRFGWTDQEIVDTLVAWRLKHGADPKEGRRDVYAQTIGKARKSGHREAAAARTVDAAAREGSGGQNELERAESDRVAREAAEHLAELGPPTAEELAEGLDDEGEGGSVGDVIQATAISAGANGVVGSSSSSGVAISRGVGSEGARPAWWRKRADTFTAMLGSPRLRAVQRILDEDRCDASFRFIFDDGSQVLASSMDMTKPDRFRRALTVIGIVHPLKMKFEEWCHIATGLISLAEDVEIYEGRTMRLRLAPYMETYYSKAKPLEWRDLDPEGRRGAIKAQTPVRKAHRGTLYVWSPLSDIMRCLRRESVGISERDVTRVFKECGLENRDLQVQVDGDRKSQGRWLLPTSGNILRAVQA